MKPAVLIGAAIVAVLGVAAIAYAVTAGDGDDEGAQAATPTPTATRTPQPSPSATPEPTQPPTSTPEPTEAPTEAPTEEPTAGPETPIPSEPPFTVTPAPTQATLPPGRYAEAAPIDQLDVRIAESFPPQYFVYIQAGLPSGCAQQYTHSVTRDGNTIEVEVLNSFPEGNPACTAIYGSYELNIALGSDFVPGQTYTVSVNDGAAETEFIAQ